MSKADPRVEVGRTGRRPRRTTQQTEQAEVPEPEADRLRTQLETVTQEAEQYVDLLRQVKADFASYKRRVEAQRAELEKQARIEILLRVLPILDDFQRALAAPPDERGSAEWAVSIERIGLKLREVLESEGVEKIDAVGALFNPWEHEALQHQTSPELEDQRILAVVRDGYRLGDRVIRPAQVVVARRSR